MNPVGDDALGVPNSKCCEFAVIQCENGHGYCRGVEGAAPYNRE